MNIQSLTSKFLRNDIITRSNHSGLNASNVSYPNLRPLEKDTVSFGAKSKLIVDTSAVTTIRDIISLNYEKTHPFLEILSKRLMDTMDAVARELKGAGLIFDRTYNEKAPIKSTNSYVSKLKRSGSTPKDPVRGTWYLRNLHDLSIFTDKILPALKERGYEIAPVAPRKKVPDFDVRLSGVSEKAKNALPKSMRDVSSFKEQGSGYGDIQFRLIDTLADKKKTTPIEIIIVAGEHTAKAKSNESYYVYDITRVLKNELHISEIKDPEIHTPAYRIINNIKIITDSLNAQISNPLYTNAKMLDIERNSNSLLSVGLDTNTVRVLPGLAEGIQNKIPLHYKAKIKEVKMDKTLSAAQRREKIELLEQQKKEDLEIITFVKNRLEETIEKYGTKS